jgi:hypothetical protein
VFRKFFISLSLLFVLIPAVLAQDPPELIGGSLLPGTGVAEGIIQANSSSWLQNVFFRNVINLLIGITAALSVVFLILGGYQYLTSVGNEEQIKQAHKTVTWSLVGVFVALLAFAIIQILVNIDFDVTSANLLRADAAEILPFAEQDWNGDAAIKNLPRSDFKEEFLPVVARFLIYGMAFVASLIFFSAGTWLVVGWGEEANVKIAKDMLIWGVSGMAYAAAGYAIVRGILGIDFSW